MSDEEVDNLFNDEPETHESHEEHESCDEEPEAPKKYLELSVPRHSNLFSTSETKYLKKPKFLKVNLFPFDGKEFKESVNVDQEYNQMLAEKLTNINTIRWRYHSINDEIVKQSNCNFIQWSDGSVSLKLGEEMFDLKEFKLSDSLLVKSFPDFEILQNDSVMKETINLVPASNINKTLNNVMKNINKKQKIYLSTTTKDPLKEQQDELLKEQQIDRMRRQLKKREEKDEKPTFRYDEYEGVEEEEEEEESYEDDFIDDDEGADRLRKLKEEGASKYDDRKRRRIIDSDEE